MVYRRKLVYLTINRRIGLPTVTKIVVPDNMFFFIMVINCWPPVFQNFKETVFCFPLDSSKYLYTLYSIFPSVRFPILHSSIPTVRPGSVIVSLSNIKINKHTSLKKFFQSTTGCLNSK